MADGVVAFRSAAFVVARGIVGGVRICARHRMYDCGRIRGRSARPPSKARPGMNRRSLLVSAVPLLFARGAFAARPGTHAAAISSATLAEIVESAAALRPLETLLVAQHGDILAAHGYRGHSVDAPTNIKSVSKAILSALVGIAIDRRLLQGTEQTIAPLLRDQLPENPDPRLARITIGHLLSMQAGLARTSGVNYGRWVASGNWVRSVLAQPFVDEPGGQMLYSTGSSHLLSAILTRRSGRSTLQLARDWLGPLPQFAITAWERGPQGIYLGGNQMAMSPRSLLAFGELYRSGGRSAEGRQLVSSAWIEASWVLRTHSRFTGDGYGYGWFQRRAGRHPAYYAYGYGGQMLYIVPPLGLTVVMTSDESTPAGRSGYRDELHRLLEQIVAAAQAQTALSSARA
jgi:CubicO group peptidase (beta-lactamase class C family)